MKLASLATLIALVVRHVHASPPEDVLTPTGIPATSGPAFSSLSFDTTAAPSLLSALSSLIFSESTALTPSTSYPSTPTTSAAHNSNPTNTLTSLVTTAPTPTGTTSGAHGSRDVRSVMVAGIVPGVVLVGYALL